MTEQDTALPGADARRARPGDGPERPLRRRWWLSAASVVSLLGVVWVLLIGPPAISHLHPAVLGVLGATTVLAVVLLVVALRGHRGRSLWRTAGLAVAAAITLVVSLASAWLRPMPATHTTVADGAVLDVRASTLVLTPAEGAARTGLVFQPGASVDPYAYLPMLSRVAAAGYEVVIIRQPLELGFMSITKPERVIAQYPEATTWVVGGHSLDGVVASEAALEDDGVDGLVLWASYPAGDHSHRDALRVTSITGSLDGLSTPAKIAAHAGMLPADTTYVVVEGGIHSYFGDYGHQRGDGEASVDRATAQDEIVGATVDALDDRAS